MSSNSYPRIATFKAGGAIKKGMGVKIGADEQHVVKGTAGTDKLIGIAQNDADNAEDPIEVALPGGGAKGLAGGAIAAGDLLTTDSTGALIATTTANNRVVAVAQQDAVLNDLFATEVQISNV